MAVGGTSKWTPPRKSGGIPSTSTTRSSLSVDIAEGDDLSFSFQREWFPFKFGMMVMMLVLQYVCIHSSIQIWDERILAIY